MKAAEPISANSVEENKLKSLYPEPFSTMMTGRSKRKLGDYFGLVNLGVNQTELRPGAMSALKHHHLTQDEFIYILSGSPTLIFGDKEYLMHPGDCFGFKKGQGVGHQLLNKSDERVIYLEIGDRSQGDYVEYPDDDLLAESGDDGTWTFLHKDGSAY